MWFISCNAGTRDYADRPAMDDLLIVEALVRFGHELEEVEDLERSARVGAGRRSRCRA